MLFVTNNILPDLGTTSKVTVFVIVPSIDNVFIILSII